MEQSRITIDQFHQLEIKIGEIISAEKVVDSDKLLRLEVNFNEEKPRQIVSGIAPYFSEPSMLIGKKCAFATNLEPRTIRGLESNGMILAVSDDNSFSLLETQPNTTIGLQVK
jgi:methionyl-tRNA synthetase